MVRRSKQDALATREALLDAAQAEFARHGVSHTSLARIAAAAGVTRGAVYWHFRDKNDLFSALMARATLPLETMWSAQAGESESLHELHHALLSALRHIATDSRLQQTFLIATQKVEYVGEQEAIRERQLAARAGFHERMAAILERIHQHEPLRLPPMMAAAALHALVDGLIYNWSLCPGGFDLPGVGGPATEAFLAGLSVDAPSVGEASPGKGGRLRGVPLRPAASSPRRRGASRP